MHADMMDIRLILLVLADCLIQLKAEIPGTIKIIHQHAEEVPPGGAKSIVESGVLDDLDAVYGTHLFPTNPAGTMSVPQRLCNGWKNIFQIENSRCWRPWLVSSHGK